MAERKARFRRWLSSPQERAAVIMVLGAIVEALIQKLL